MSTDTSVYEEERLALMYPWQCYSSELRVFQEYSTLEQLCDADELTTGEVREAIKSNGGNIKGLHVVKR